MRRVRNRWGEPVFRLIACLLQHARDRCYFAGDDDSWLDIRYWVCAYATTSTRTPPFPAVARACDQPCVALSSVRAGWEAL